MTDKRKKYKYTDEQFIKAVANNFSISGVMRELCIASSGSAYLTINQKVRKLGLNTSHWTGQRHNKGKKIPGAYRRLVNEVLVEESDYPRAALRRRIIKEQMLKYECALCNLIEWKGNKLSLHLDHINGKNCDHRLENLRFLCPNCHSQTDTWAGKNIGNNGHYVPEGIKNSRDQKENKSLKVSKKYQSRKHKRKVERPPYEDLIIDISSLGFCGTGRKYGVTDNAIRKWIKHYENCKKLGLE